MKSWKHEDLGSPDLGEVLAAGVAELALGVAALLIIRFGISRARASSTSMFVDFDALMFREGQAQRGQPRLVLGAHGDLDGVEEADGFLLIGLRLVEAAEDDHRCGGRGS